MRIYIDNSIWRLKTLSRYTGWGKNFKFLFTKTIVDIFPSVLDKGEFLEMTELELEY